MLNPLRYVERLLKWQQQFSPVYPMVIARELNKEDTSFSWLQITWMCDKFIYIVLIFEGKRKFQVSRFPIDTPTNYTPSYRGYYPSVDFSSSHLLFDEIEYIGEGRTKYIKIIKGFRIQSIKEQCFI